MMRSLFSGVSGMRVHQTKMDVISNNVANVNTAGYKSSRVTFSEVFSQTLSGASGANANSGRGGINPTQIGLGAAVASIDVQMTQGAAQRTDNPLDLKINGDAFFIVSKDGARDNYFTKAGAFRLDNMGNLVNPNGYKVMGWTTSKPSTTTPGDIEFIKTNVTPIKITSPENMYIAPEVTTEASLSGNISLADQTINKSFTFYDTVGNKYDLAVQLTYNDSEFETDGTTPNPNYQKWVMEFGTEMTMNDSTKISFGEPMGSLLVSFNKAGEINTIEPNAGSAGTVQPSPGGGTGTSVTSFFFDFKNLVPPPDGSLPVVAEFGDANNQIKVDLSNLTQYTGKTNASIRANGQQAGELSGYSIGGDGIITGRYTNGKTKKLGQLAVAQFDNPAGLEKMGENLFTTTPNSGGFDGIGQDPQLGGGSISAGVLEMSNVDLAAEFTDMITTQRGFQANSRIITTSDEILQELVNLKR